MWIDFLKNLQAQDRTRYRTLFAYRRPNRLCEGDMAQFMLDVIRFRAKGNKLNAICHPFEDATLFLSGTFGDAATKRTKYDMLYYSRRPRKMMRERFTDRVKRECLCA